ASFNFLEQPDILDGDDGLVGESVEQLDLLGGEGPNLEAADNERADRLRIAQEGNRKDCAMTLAHCVGTAFGEFLALREKVVDVHGNAIDNSASGEPLA